MRNLLLASACLAAWTVSPYAQAQSDDDPQLIMVEKPDGTVVVFQGNHQVGTLVTDPNKTWVSHCKTNPCVNPNVKMKTTIFSSPDAAQSANKPSKLNLVQVGQGNFQVRQGNTMVGGGQLALDDKWKPEPPKPDPTPDLGKASPTPIPTPHCNINCTVTSVDTRLIYVRPDTSIPQNLDQASMQQLMQTQQNAQ